MVAINQEKSSSLAPKASTKVERLINADIFLYPIWLIINVTCNHIFIGHIISYNPTYLPLFIYIYILCIIYNNIYYIYIYIILYYVYYIILYIYMCASICVYIYMSIASIASVTSCACGEAFVFFHIGHLAGPGALAR